ncbi:SufB/SufD family protein [Halothermothrix orenii]|uniref:SufBD protein n=1 Tax=Halothermothrix orenii (strain H 168 / OCM 544 / DSM 9562) TaxID=373903 RepID=B8CZ40_HALOH|nr:SufD family Fe-S cluster assembly protein [Halothermothrix orenii]ACL70559.1 SufBD protein [Halothermothrix orenii H 168]
MKLSFDEEFKMLVDAFEKSGGDGSVFSEEDGGFLLINANRVVGVNEVEGLKIDTEPQDDGVKVRIEIADGARFKKPMHMCFGVTHKEGLQYIQAEYVVGEDAEVHLLAHCSFPKAKKVIHKMDADIHLKKNAILTYEEVHYHGQEAGVEVIPKTRAKLDEGAYFFSEFKLVKGRVGKLDVDIEVDQAKKSASKLISKVYGKETDSIKIKERLNLNEEGSKGLAKTRVFAADQTVSEVIGEAYGNAPNVKGHIDCVEAVKGEAEVSAIPIIKVNNDLAELSHEASIGRINQKQLETLIARGLSEDEATDLIVNGMLR